MLQSCISQRRSCSTIVMSPSKHRYHRVFVSAQAYAYNSGLAANDLHTDEALKTLCALLKPVSEGTSQGITCYGLPQPPQILAKYQEAKAKRAQHGEAAIPRSATTDQSERPPRDRFGEQLQEEQFHGGGSGYLLQGPYACSR